MIAAVTVDAAGAKMGGAARYLTELYGYLARTGREDVKIIGSRRRVRKQSSGEKRQSNEHPNSHRSLLRFDGHGAPAAPA